MNTLVVLPSFNERDNICNLIGALLDINRSLRVCVVDDSSPDGTSNLVRQTIDGSEMWRERVHLITRSKKDGRGGAVRDGFAWGLKNDPEIRCFVEMDCDFSHEPSAIARGVALLENGADVALGCRYPDGTIIGWPWSRRVFSFFANSLAKALIDRRIPDYTNGFRFYTRRAVELMASFPQTYKGYIYLSESLSHLLKANMKIECFPTVFKNRVRGVSNTSLKEIVNALSGIFVIAKRHHAR
jgi:dolichol-phosphate mannosyltransferase